MGVLDFFSREAGQARRAALDSALKDAASYYLGPTGMDARLGLLGMMNPITDLESASQNAQRVGRGDMDALVPMITDMATVAAPAIGARIAGGPAVHALTEGLLGIGAPAREGMSDAARRFAADESGAIKLPVGTGAKATGIRAYHGSPHDFDRFSMDAIGTGEGAQAYGHGLYFAENEGVARGYRDVLSNDVSSIGDMAVNTTRAPEDAINAWRAASGNLPKNVQDAVAGKLGARLSAREILDDLDIDFYGEYNDEVSKIIQSTPGRMYEVNINANPDDFLDWDAPLSEQTEGVKRAFLSAQTQGDPLLSDLLDTSPEGLMLQGMVPNAKGSAGYRTYIDDIARSGVGPGLRAEQIGSQELRDAGIPGIKYLDAGSRGAGDGSRNFVVFDENLIEIVRKYGIAGAAAMLGMSQADVVQAMGQSANSGILSTQPERGMAEQEARQHLGGLIGGM